MEGKDGSIPSVKPDYEWEIDSRRKMWVYLEEDGVAMILVEGKVRHYQGQEPEKIINALFEYMLKKTIEMDEIKHDLEELQHMDSAASKNSRLNKIKKISLFKRDEGFNK